MKREDDRGGGRQAGSFDTWGLSYLSICRLLPTLSPRKVTEGSVFESGSRFFLHVEKKISDLIILINSEYVLYYFKQNKMYAYIYKRMPFYSVGKKKYSKLK